MKVKVYMYAQFNKYAGESGDIEYIPHYAGPEISGHMGVFIHKTEIECPVQDRAAIINDTVKAMKHQQHELRAKCETEVQQIEQQIQEMLCLPAEIDARKE